MGRVVVSTSSFGLHDPRPLELLEAAGHVVAKNPHGRRLEPAETRGLLAEADGIVAGTETLDREILTAAGKLRVISRCGVGIDGVDLDAAADLGIKVLATSHAHIDPVAELTLAGILSLLRHVATSDRELRAGTWRKPMGRLLRGKSVGLIGLGRTARRLVALLAPFDCPIFAYDVREDPAFADANAVTYGSLEAVIEQSDIISLHVAYSPELRHMIGESEIGRMKQGALLVNTARGGLVDEAALAIALGSGHLGGAYLDVYEQEPYDGPLTRSANALLTSHIGSYAVEGRIEMEIEAVENLLRALEETA